MRLRYIAILLIVITGTNYMKCVKLIMEHRKHCYKWQSFWHKYTLIN